MKQRLIFYLFVLMLTVPRFCNAGQATYDTVPVKTGIYEVKEKNETIFAIAAELKLDLQTISLLNDSIPIDKILEPGQKIVIPVNPSGSMPVNKDVTKDTTGSDLNGGTNQVSRPVVVQTHSSAPIDTELLQSKIMLLDATLDLNEALLQGIKASLDSLNVKTKGVVDEKNMQATIRSMQRNRDKALLTPFLLHMQDSLNIEIAKEKSDRAALQFTLTGAQQQPVVPDITTHKFVVDSGWSNDTQTHVNVPAKVEPATPPAHAPITFDSLHIRPVVEAATSSEPASSPPVKHWAAAIAVYENEDTLAEEHPEIEAAVVDTETLQNSRDTDGYCPSGQQAAMSDSVRIIKAQLYLTRARKASNEKNYKTAIEDLKRSIDLSPGYYDARFALGEADMHVGQYSKALGEFKTCAKIDSSKAALYYKMGSVELKLKQLWEAESYFNKSLALDPSYVPALMGTGQIFADRKDYSTAVAQYRRVLEIDHGYHSAYKAKAMAEYWLKSYEAAIDDFTRFLIFDEGSASAYYYRGLSKMGLHQTTDGCADLSFAAKLGSPAAAKALQTRCK